MRRLLLWAAVPVAGLVILFGVWSLFFAGRHAPEPLGPPPVLATDAAGPATGAHGGLSPRWIPDWPELVLSLDVATLEASAGLESLTRAFPIIGEAVADRLFQGFGLRPNAVRRVTWSAAHLNDWIGKGVVVIELAEGQSAAVFRSAGNALDWKLHEISARQLGRPAWPLPYVVLDDSTIVTGEEALLRRLAERGETPAELGLLAPFLASAPSDADLIVAIDLVAAKKAGWPLPAGWLDVWPQGKVAWNVIWEMPGGLGVAFDGGDFALLEVALLCDGHTAADKVRAALEQWTPQAKSVLAARIDELAASVAAGRIAAADAPRYETALRGSLAALEIAHVELVDRSVWVRADCGSNSTQWTAAASRSKAAIEADWLRAAGTLDEAVHTRLREALAQYDVARGEMPPGVLSGGLLPPDTRLSWITAMLPYLGHESWSEQLNSSYSWNSPQNRPIATRELAEVLNPAVGVRKTESGYPVSHYVGMAGIGADAATLARDDPRAGIFGHQSSRRLDDIPDGASNTIATVGVTGGLGSWAAGGPATVRGLAQKPYVNGPDGFGSGQPGGMYVGMADGSARFLSKDTDGTVIEQLATAAGGEPVRLGPAEPRVASLEPKVTSLEPKAASLEPKVEEPDVRPAADPGDDSGPGEPAGEPVRTPDAPTHPAAEIDAAEQLAVAIPGIAITDVPLKDAVEVLRRFGGFRVTYDLDAMSEIGVRLDRPVRMHRTETTIGESLDSVLASCGLAAVVRGEQVLITGQSESQGGVRTVRYTVDDLGPDGQAVAELATRITRLIDPESWQTAGGTGTIEVTGAVLAIAQSEPIHRQILTFCEKLRVARGLPTRSNRPAEQFQLASRNVQASPLLRRRVTLNFFEPAPIERIVEELARVTESQISVNWLALAATGKSPVLAGTLIVRDATLEGALNELLEPVGLTYRVVDRETVEVTTRSAAEAHLEREFYPVGDLVKKGHSGAALIEQIREEVGPATWNEAGGPGAIFFDAPSGCLIVFQTHRVQSAIERLLDALRQP